MSMTDRPIEAGIYTLIGADDDVGVNEFSATVDIDLGQTYGATQVRPVAGEIQSILLVSSAAAAPIEPTGWLFFMDADPATAAGDAALALVDRQAIIAQVEIAAADWDSDGTGATAYKVVALPFHDVRYLYTVFRNEGAAINAAGGDDELIEINLWYRRDN